MNIFKKVMALFKVKSFIETEIKEAKAMDKVGTPGWKTSEFWLHLVQGGAVLWGTVRGFVPPKYALVAETVALAVYTIARTAYKAYVTIKSGQVTVETPTTQTNVTVNP